MEKINLTYTKTTEVAGLIFSEPFIDDDYYAGTFGVEVRTKGDDFNSCFLDWTNKYGLNTDPLYNELDLDEVSGAVIGYIEQLNRKIRALLDDFYENAMIGEVVCSDNTVDEKHVVITLEHNGSSFNVYVDESYEVYIDGRTFDRTSTCNFIDKSTLEYIFNHNQKSPLNDLNNLERYMTRARDKYFDLEDALEVWGS